MDRSIIALRAMAILIREYNVEKIRICGTEALRRAINSNLLLSECQEILGFPLEIIDGEQEALLTQAGFYPNYQFLMPVALSSMLEAAALNVFYLIFPNILQSVCPLGLFR